eukprot:scaffold1940_cov112-Isochrysis_galbana.AAC.5
MAVSGLSGGSGAPSACGPTNFDKWRRFDADGAVDALERREAEREALRLKLTRLENGRAQAALRRRQLAAEAEAEALKARGNACFGSARYEDAVADYTEALESTPRSATLYANRAMALLKVRTQRRGRVAWGHGHPTTNLRNCNPRLLRHACAASTPGRLPFCPLTPPSAIRSCAPSQRPRRMRRRRSASTQLTSRRGCGARMRGSRWQNSGVNRRWLLRLGRRTPPEAMEGLEMALEAE